MAKDKGDPGDPRSWVGDEARRILGEGIPDMELPRWVTWERDLDIVAAWREAGYSSREAEALRYEGLDPAAAAAWRAEGAELTLIAEALRSRMGPVPAVQWWQAGFGPYDATSLMDTGIDLQAATQLQGELGSVAAVMRTLEDER